MEAFLMAPEGTSPPCALLRNCSERLWTHPVSHAAVQAVFRCGAVLKVKQCHAHFGPEWLGTAGHWENLRMLGTASGKMRWLRHMCWRILATAASVPLLALPLA